MNNANYDEFHLSGYGMAAKVGLNLQFYKGFFLRTEYKMGLIKLNSIRTTISKQDTAKQNILFRQINMVVGFSRPLF